MRAVGSLLLLALVPATLAVKSQDFKTCSQAAFCRRGRALSARAQESQSWKSPYSVDASSVAVSPERASFTAAVRSSLYPDVKFSLDVRVHDDGVVRVRMDEVDGLKKRYDEAASWALIAEPTISHDVKWAVGPKHVRATYGAKKDIEVVVSYEPLTVTLHRNGHAQVVLNGRGLLHMEHFRSKASSEETAPVDAPTDDSQVVMQVNNRAWFEGEEEDGFWDEKFGSWTDSKPKGKSVVHLCPTSMLSHV